MVRVAALIAIALMLAPALVAAQATEPVGTISEDETTVSRAYDAGGFGDDTIIGIFAIGSIADSDAQAIGMMATIPSVLASGLASTLEDSGATLGEPQEMTVAPIGDQATGLRMTLTALGAGDGEVVVLAVRQASWVQVLVGMGLGTASVQPRLETLARQVQPRWPSAEPITVRPDGLRTGGIWSTMPLPEDMPAGFTIDPAIEDGPGPTAGVAPQPGASTGPASDLPLLPTPTPAGGVPALPQETPAVESPIETPTASGAPAEPPVATPAPNPRLALPFTVTVEVFLPLDLATIEEDGSCRGAGMLEGLSDDAEMTLRETRAGGASATAPIAAPGQVTFDRQTGEDICYFRATLTDVPPRPAYTLLAGETVLGQYTYDELTETGSILVVVGGE